MLYREITEVVLSDKRTTAFIFFIVIVQLFSILMLKNLRWVCKGGLHTINKFMDA
jgi:hypothetical protein